MHTVSFREFFDLLAEDVEFKIYIHEWRNNQRGQVLRERVGRFEESEFSFSGKWLEFIFDAFTRGKVRFGNLDQLVENIPLEGGSYKDDLRSNYDMRSKTHGDLVAVLTVKAHASNA